MVEEWKDVEGYEGFYQVSSEGRVRSIERTVSSRWASGCTYHEKMLSVSLSGRYKHITLTKGAVPKGFSVHRLVAKAFVPNLEGKPEVNPIDGNRSNNSADNLEWCNASENAIHALSLGLRKSVKGEKHGRSKLTKEQATDVKYSSEGRHTLAERYDITWSGVYQIQTGYKWKHI